MQACLQRIKTLEALLAESEETLGAIGRGDFDAVVTKDTNSVHRVYTLENADRPYQLLIEQIQEGAVTLGADGTVFYCNRRMAAMLGCPQEQLVGQLLQRFVRPDERPAFTRLLAVAREGAARSEFYLGDEQRWDIPVYVSLSPLPNAGGLPLLCGVVGDLTQQNLHLRALSEANAGLLAASAQRDMAEDALRQSQKMEAVGQLSGGLAHDFNNLLAVIIGSLELLRADLHGSDNSRLEANVDVALASASRAAILTHRLLAFSRRQTLAPKLIAINSLVSEIEELVRRTVGPSMELVSLLHADAGTIFCDGNQLENAVINLAINARDAMPDGGQFTIATANLDLDAAAASALDVAPGPYVALSVADSGIGMAAAVAARAFDPFFTTKPIGKGTGLGLSMIYGFAKQSGGQVNIRSAEGVGTTVTIYLPRVAAPEAARSPERSALRPPRAPSDSKGGTVLLIDDEPDLRAVLVRMLRRLGYCVIHAADARAGLSHVEAGTHIDLMITDIGLPGGMNGRQLAEAVWVMRPKLRVLFITGFAETAAMGAGVEVITKPFEMDVFTDKIRDLMNTGDRIAV